MTALPIHRDDAVGVPGRGAITRPLSGLRPIQRLEGHSGATLILYDQGRSCIVRKTAATPGSNARLLRQATLQRQLSICSIPFPRVLAEGLDGDGLAFFDMEYVPASNLAALICRASPLDREPLVPTLDRIFRFFRLTAADALPSSLFYGKIDQVAQQCADLDSCALRLPLIAKMAARLGAHSWDGIPSSLCHGDMTLENMLLCPARGLVFVDCDDGFASSYWLDAGKLFQDIAGHWCLRGLYAAGAQDAELAGATRRLEQLAPMLRAMLALMDPQLVLRLPQLAALNLFRTLPYSRDQRLVSFVLERIAHVLDCAQW